MTLFGFCVPGSLKLAVPLIILGMTLTVTALISICRALISPFGLLFLTVDIVYRIFLKSLSFPFISAGPLADFFSTIGLLNLQTRIFALSLSAMLAIKIL